MKLMSLCLTKTNICKNLKKIDSVAEQVKSIANNSDCQQKIEKDDIKIVKL